MEGRRHPWTVLKGHQGNIRAVAWSPDGKRLVSAGWDDKTVRLWNAADGSPGPVFKYHDSRVTWVAWCSDGQRLASAFGSGLLWVTNLADGTGWTAALLPDGQPLTLSAAGELLHGKPDAAETALAYVVEGPDGRFEVLSPSAFLRRVAAASNVAR